MTSYATRTRMRPERHEQAAVGRLRLVIPPVKLKIAVRFIDKHQLGEDADGWEGQVPPSASSARCGKGANRVENRVRQAGTASATLASIPPRVIFE
jgi:hypothetical protein